MRDCCQSMGQSSQLSIDQRKRITAAENDFSDRGVGFDLSNCRLPLGHRMGPIAIRKVPAEAVSAMDGTGPGCYHQGSTVVLVEQARCKRCVQVSDGVGREADRGASFLRQRQYLPQQRIVGITPAHPGDKATRGENGEIRGRGLTGHVCWQADEPAEFGCVAHGILHRLLPSRLARQGAADNFRLRSYNLHFSPTTNR